MLVEDANRSATLAFHDPPGGVGAHYSGESAFFLCGAQLDCSGRLTC